MKAVTHYSRLIAKTGQVEVLLFDAFQYFEATGTYPHGYSGIFDRKNYAIPEAEALRLVNRWNISARGNYIYGA